jgi:hypothetical protein
LEGANGRGEAVLDAEMVHAFETRVLLAEPVGLVSSGV